MNPRQLRIEDYTYHLPDQKIAHHPLPQRDAAKLLIYKNGDIRQSIFADLADELPSDCLLVFNQTKVVHARLIFQKQTGGKVEIFCLSPDQRYTNTADALSQKKQVYWNCMVGGAAKWKKETSLILKREGLTLSADFVAREGSGYAIIFSWDDEHKTFAEVLQILGKVPLPPYITRAAEASDESSYQTVFAKNEGSVAAPTASLHFTDEMLDRIGAKGIAQARITLHVGAGTFLPVKSAQMEGHSMHEEWIEVDAANIRELFDARATRKIIATGTTALRTLESLYWMGCKVLRNPFTEDLTVAQWEPYDPDEHFSTDAARAALLEWLNTRGLTKLVSKTGILIAPGYSFKMVDGLITNFHQPQSTLLLLVAAFIGDDWRRVYGHAMENNFRFLSYGDGSLLWRGEGAGVSL